MNRLWQIITFPVWGPVKLVVWLFKSIGKGIIWLFNGLKKSLVFLINSLPTLLVLLGIGLAVMSGGEGEVLNIAILIILAGVGLAFIRSAWRKIRRRSGAAGRNRYSSAILDTLPIVLILAGHVLIVLCEGRGDLARVSIGLLYGGLGLAFIRWLWKKIRRTHRTTAQIPAGASGRSARPSGIGGAIRWVFTAPFRLICLLLKLPFMPIVFLWKAMRGPNSAFLFKTTSTAFALASVFFGLAFLKYVLFDRPRFGDRLYKYDTYRALIVMDRNTRLLGVFGGKKRIYKPIKDIPVMLQYAFISAEDKRFEKHFGLDPIGMASAMKDNVMGILTGRKPRGASTITQQVVKNYLLQTKDGENIMQKVSRKVTEFFAAIELEQRFGKKEILEIYLNEIYLGMGAYGVVAAAECYFNKTLDELTIDEMALIGGLPQLPGRNPHNKNVDIKKVKKRRNYVIERMEKNGYISSEEARVARNANINNVKFNPLNQDENKALEGYVMDELRRLGYTEDQIKGKGFKVYLTIDLKAQRAAMAALKYGVRQVQKRHGGTAPQAALVAIDSKGDLIAMLGGVGYYDEEGSYQKNELNRALALRQPGSTMKPLVYAAALESRAISPYDTFDASALVIDGRIISDHCDTLLSFTEAIAQSSNRAAIRVYLRTGWRPVINLARQMGVETPMPDSPRLPLGVSETRLLDMTNAYVPFFNQGVMRRKPRIIFKIRDEQGKDHEHRGGWATQVMSASTAELIRSALRATVVSEKGTGTAVRSIRDAAGKTGTTNNNRDALFIGAAPSRFGTTVVGVWVGFDRNESLGPGSTESGGRTSAPIWAQFFKNIQR